MPKFGTKNALFGYFWARIFNKKLLSYLKSTPLNLPNGKISRNNEKCRNLGPKMPFFGNLGPKMPFFDNLGPNMPYLIKKAAFGYFWAKI